MQAASHVIVVVPCAKCACRWRTSGASAVGERDRLDQLLDVDLARAGEAGLAVAEGLARTRSVAARATPCGRRRDAALERGQELAQVAVAPARAAAWSGPSGRAGTRGSASIASSTGWSVPLLALLDRLDHEQPQRHAGLLDPVDLGRDERLGDPREPHQDVGDGPVHTLVTTATRPDVTLLRNLLLSLDQTTAPVEVFFRDDDAGWEDERLLELIAPLRRARAPAGPRGDPGGAAPSALAARLIERPRRPAPARLRAHQPPGRGAQVRVRPGRDRARSSARTSPPARRGCGSCSATASTRSSRRPGTAARATPARCWSSSASRCSRASTAPSRSACCPSCPCTSTSRACRRTSSTRASRRGSTPAAPVGVMFHHGVMEPDDMERASELLALLAGHEARATALYARSRLAANAARMRGRSARLRARTGAVLRAPSAMSAWI